MRGVLKGREVTARIIRCLPPGGGVCRRSWTVAVRRRMMVLPFVSGVFYERYLES
ncbi:hypothetical protein HMPREF9080_00123 [Cardiobacterium valvarum F0432]|uniref:Uncharacterized protein n=1 Tax=Cardiobacterium valvarum F0432 TaxID=797473 RepID=G9ZBK0_9GAMM|nr:hypothetical protein HMPREF9080_00123 [Cardiobacterium valvarum F0432]